MAGRTLLAFLAERFRYHTAEEWRERILDGRVTVGGEHATPERRLTRGAVVGYARTEREPDVPTDIRVVHDEGGVVVIDKPAGLPFHADGTFVTHTVVGVLEHRLGARLRPIQRLDRETSGLCVLARDRATARALQTELAAHGFEKTYDAIVRGVVTRDRFVVDAPIAHHPDSEISVRRAVVAPGTPGAGSAMTEFEVIARGARATWLRCRPRTGRTHQIRVHLDSAGAPLFGDKLYGRTDQEHLAWLAHVKAGGDPAWGDTLEAPRQMLHASALAFTDPERNRRLAFSAPPPEDFLRCVRREIGDAPTSA